MNRDQLSRQLKALADPMRLRILDLLPNQDRCEDVYNVSELARELGISQPSVSHHLAILRSVELVQSRKMCRDVYYWINVKQYQSLMKTMARLTDRPARALVRSS
jgi:ArsR family transcriptional regulator